MVSKSRLILMLIRGSVCAEERHELFSHMWRWLALGVLRLGWRTRLFRLLGYRLHMIIRHGRLHALPDGYGEETPDLVDDEGEGSSCRRVRRRI